MSSRYPYQPWQKLYCRAAWKKIRQHHLTLHPLCAWHLKKTPPQMVRATVVHHLTPHKGDLVLFYDPNNLESLCAPCHDSKAQQDEKWGYSLEVGTDGWPIDPKHPANR
jgi:5-methylcytosine-specific restriction endonuclease McrA